MSFRVHIGMWEDGLTVSPSPDDEAAFMAMGRMEATLVNRTFCLAFGAAGVAGYFYEPGRARNAGRALFYEVLMPRSGFTCRFALHEVTAELVGDDLLTWEAPPDHLLPWPNCRRVRAPEEAAARELTARLRSALRAGDDEARRCIRGTPDWVRDVLGPAGWEKAVRLAKEETYECT